MALLAFAAPCVAQEGDVVKQVLAQWAARQGQYKTVRYKISGTVDIREMPVPRGVPPIMLRPDERVRPISAAVAIDFVNRRMRIDSREETYPPDKGRFVPRVTTDAYNGKVYQTALPRTENELAADDHEMMITSGSLHRVTVNNSFWPIFFASGFVCSVHAPLRVDKWPTSYEPEDFISQGRVDLQGRPCEVVRTQPASSQPPSSNEYWIDSKGMNGAVRRHVVFNGKNPGHIQDIEYVKDGDDFRPSAWTTTWTMAGRVQTITRYTVDLFEADVALNDSDFTLSIERGMRVHRYDVPAPGTGLNPERPARKLVIVDASGNEKVQNNVGYTTANGEVLPPNDSGYHWLWWTGILLTALTLTLVSLRLYRKRRPA